MENFIQKHKQLLQSLAIFFGWLLMIYAGIFFIPALFLLSMPEKLLSISTTITLASLFILGLFTVREKNWSFVGWAALTIALGFLLFSIPNGIQLIYLVLATGLTTIASYYGFANLQRQFSPTVIIMGIIFLVVFISHAVILSIPQKFGLKIQGNELSTFTMEALQQVAQMDPVEFVKTNKGREIAVKVYNTSIFISQEELEKIVKENPDPLKEVQTSLLSIKNPFKDNPYSYILNVYAYPLIKFLREEVRRK
jgi:uncharacterized membrane protein (DUF485 family)